MERFEWHSRVGLYGISSRDCDVSCQANGSVFERETLTVVVIEENEMTAVAKKRLTAEEYLAIERKAEFRSEYFAGEMFAMSGASREHNLIVSNLNREVGEQLKDRPCEIYPSDMRVRIPSGLYTYPDVVVVCGSPKFDDDHVDTLLNPLVLIEVLSESTADYDRGTKFKHYRQITSLREYVLVDQEATQIEHFALGGDGKWSLTEIAGLDQVLKLNSIECQIPLFEIYRKVTFKEADSGELP